MDSFPADDHLGNFDFRVIMNYASVNIFMYTQFSTLLDMYPVLERLDGNCVNYFKGQLCYISK